MIDEAGPSLRLRGSILDAALISLNKLGGITMPPRPVPSKCEKCGAGLWLTVLEGQAWADCRRCGKVAEWKQGDAAWTVL